MHWYLLAINNEEARKYYKLMLLDKIPNDPKLEEFRFLFWGNLASKKYEHTYGAIKNLISKE